MHFNLWKFFSSIRDCSIISCRHGTGVPQNVATGILNKGLSWTGCEKCTEPVPGCDLWELVSVPESDQAQRRAFMLNYGSDFTNRQQWRKRRQTQSYECDKSHTVWTVPFFPTRHVWVTNAKQNKNEAKNNMKTGTDNPQASKEMYFKNLLEEMRQ